jgi:hypothetical protein
MIQLETICANKVQALRDAYVPEELIRCRNCDNYNQECYIPFRPQGEPIRTGRLSYVLQREGVR